MTTTNDLQAAVDDRFPEHLELVRSFIRRPSISHTGEGMAETIAYCCEAIRAAGGSAEAVDVGGNYPIVFGEIDVGSDVTFGVYGMYDVQPADEPDWVAAPFAAEVRDWNGLGPCIIGRGAVNTKGPLQAFFNVVGLLRGHQSLPCNLLFVIEGEEEMGSGSMAPFVSQYRDRLRAANAFIHPFFTQESDGAAVFNLGVRGLLQSYLVAEGGDWGGPRTRDIHGGNAAWMSNPAWKLVHALADLVSKDDEILVPGFAEDAAPISEEDLALIGALEGRMNVQAHLDRNDAVRFRYQASDADLVRHLIFDPTCNISGLLAGYTGDGFKTLVPHRAEARMDLRMVPGMDPDRVIGRVRSWLLERGHDKVRFEVDRSYPASKVPYSNPYVQAAVRMYRHLEHDPIIWPMLHGAAPFYLFEQVLERPWIMAGLGHGARQHSSNEYCTVEGIRLFEKSMIGLLDEMAAVNRT